MKHQPPASCGSRSFRSRQTFLPLPSSYFFTSGRKVSCVVMEVTVYTKPQESCLRSTLGRMVGEGVLLGLLTCFKRQLALRL